MKNKFVVFEGIDGVGKTSLAKNLKAILLDMGIPTIIYEEAEDKHKGFNMLKPFIKKNVSINSSLFFYLASSINKSDIVKELLKTTWVIGDRYIYSTLASHFTRGASRGILARLDKLPILKPNHIFLVKANEKTRTARIKARHGNHEADRMKKIKDNNIWLMEKELEKLCPITVDNSKDNIDEVMKNIIKIIFLKK
jgi:dTMP kinase